MKAVIRMTAGLANRMFQYAYYQYLTEHGIDAYVDNSYKPKKYTFENIEWNRIFKNAPIRQAPKSLILRLGGGYDLISRIRIHFSIFSKVYMYPNFSAIDYTEIKDDCYLICLFAHKKISESIRNIILEKYEFTPFSDKKNIELQREMESSESIAIHFRKGIDYMQLPKIQGTCPIEYYEKAIDIIKQKVKNPKFYVFTDNHQWVKDNIHGIDYILVDNPVEGWGNHFDMQLMSCCKHNIIANSTYSWWGAYLNKNPEKTVIMPEQWFNPKIKSLPLMDQLKCDGWISL